METLNVIHRRRAVRDYSPKKIDREDVKQLIDAAVWAPSATNSQPWAFVVIEDERVLKRYSDLAKTHLLKVWGKKPPDSPYVPLLNDSSYNIFYNAKTAIVICARPNGHDPSGDCHLAAQNMMLAACDRGLATCPIGLAREMFNRPDIKKELGIPPEYSAVLAIIVGYPVAEPPSTERRPAKILKWVEPHTLS